MANCSTNLFKAANEVTKVTLTPSWKVSKYKDVEDELCLRFESELRFYFIDDFFFLEMSCSEDGLLQGVLEEDFILVPDAKDKQIRVFVLTVELLVHIHDLILSVD